MTNFDKLLQSFQQHSYSNLRDPPPMQFLRYQLKNARKHVKKRLCRSAWHGFKKKRKKFWLTRYNSSTINGHISFIHKDDEVTTADVVPADAPQAKEAFRLYKSLQEKSNVVRCVLSL